MGRFIGSALEVPRNELGSLGLRFQLFKDNLQEGIGGFSLLGVFPAPVCPYRTTYVKVVPLVRLTAKIPTLPLSVAFLKASVLAVTLIARLAWVVMDPTPPKLLLPGTVGVQSGVLPSLRM